ncbi:MAG TPA: zinc ribbon domain-containing protein [Anaerolineales bacterium]|nr:zinc ribbon domain-containing protein [Anaerolineales bacterium]
MQLVSIFLALGIAVFVGLYLYAPFLERRARRVTAEEHELSALLAERERTLSALQELDFDYRLGKVPEEEYPVQRANLLQKGADVLKRIDELTPQKARSHKDADIERAIASRRRKTAVASITDDDIESMIVQRRKGRKTKTAGFCPKCGKAVMVSDKFCPACGKVLS